MKLIKWIILTFMLTVIFPVTAAPILNITAEPIGQTLSQEQVKKVIMMAALNRGWQLTELAEGQFKAVLDIRKHQAIVRIDYTDSNYSITYLDSTNLKAKNGQIHKNYNNWITNLSNDIKRFAIQISLTD